MRDGSSASDDAWVWKERQNREKEGGGGGWWSGEEWKEGDRRRWMMQGARARREARVEMMLGPGDGRELQVM